VVVAQVAAGTDRDRTDDQACVAGPHARPRRRARANAACADCSLTPAVMTDRGEPPVSITASRDSPMRKPPRSADHALPTAAVPLQVPSGERRTHTPGDVDSGRRRMGPPLLLRHQVRGDEC
jgi:hypothetical protein